MKRLLYFHALTLLAHVSTFYAQNPFKFFFGVVISPFYLLICLFLPGKLKQEKVQAGLEDLIANWEIGEKPMPMKPIRDRLLAMAKESECKP